MLVLFINVSSDGIVVVVDGVGIRGMRLRPMKKEMG
jgi:hypothetical protein